ncbi:MAG: class II fructose-bisphosphatase [Deltaproteobacteria bacterium]|jgi:fructose-1,6-bisphosphatase class II|nr:class II fructose-bisphosphatase [Deltaproteobacteria bacterium]
MDKNLALEMTRVTEAAALAAARQMGRGSSEKADQVAVDAMRTALNTMSIKGTVVIGEGERDEAPMLYIGEKVGVGDGPEIDIALDPLEGTTVCATGKENSLTVIAMADTGNFLHAPDTYMWKIAVGPDARDVIDIKRSATQNLVAIAERKRCEVRDLTAIILNRPRHEKLITEVRQAGARIRLIDDGDVSAAIATCEEDSGIDVLLGSGGAPEGVLAAAALRCLGGDMQGKLMWRNAEEQDRAKKMGIEDLDRIYGLKDLAKGNVMFAATGVTTGTFLKGVRFYGGGASTHSVVMRSETGTVRYIEATHDFKRKPFYTTPDGSIYLHLGEENK